MIRYSLSCAQGHAFESWFADAGAFEALARAGQVSCPFCGGTQVEKALMAPAVRPARKVEAREAGAGAHAGALAGQRGAGRAGPASSLTRREIEQAIAELRRQVEANSEYVGSDFAVEARRIHDGEALERAIHGEARPDEARRLIEDGIPVMPLPFLPTRKLN